MLLDNYGRGFAAREAMDVRGLNGAIADNGLDQGFKPDQLIAAVREERNMHRLGSSNGSLPDVLANAGGTTRESLATIEIG